MCKQIILFCLVIVGVYSFSSSQLNNRTIIGIQTSPSTYSKYPGRNYSYIAASYVKLIEAAGAQVVPIPYDATLEYLDNLFSKINGILFPGGSVEFTFQDTVDQIFLRNAAYLIQKAKNATDSGDFFPVWGTCQGFQLIHYIESGYDKSVIKAGYNDTASHTTLNIDYSSKLFQNMPSNLIHHIENFPAVYYHHNRGVQTSAYAKNQQLSSSLKYTSTALSVKNVPFIATFESIDYPIYGSQFHPEKNMFEWKVNAARDYESNLVAQYFTNFFVNQARQNLHSFDRFEEEADYLIYQYPVYALKTSSYSQIYILPNFGNPEVDYNDAYVPQTKSLLYDSLYSAYELADD